MASSTLCNLLLEFSPSKEVSLKTMQLPESSASSSSAVSSLSSRSGGRKQFFDLYFFVEVSEDKSGEDSVRSFCHVWDSLSLFKWSSGNAAA